MSHRIGRGGTIDFIRDGEMWVLLDRRRDFQLVFRPWLDQFEHFLGFYHSGLSGDAMHRGERDFERVARSVEGHHDLAQGQVEPTPSPAYQEITHQIDGDSHGFLLVGRHGNHHYSAVFALTSNDAATSLEVDVADRCRKSPQPLICSYSVRATLSDLRELDKTRAVWDIGPMVPVPVAFETTAETNLRLGEHSLGKTLVQAVAEHSISGHTTRCRFVWRFADSETEGRTAP